MEQRVVVREEVVFDFFSPTVTKSHSKFVVKEVDVGSLIPPITEKLSPILLNYLGRGWFPGFQFFNLFIIDFVELLLICAKQIC